MQLNTSRKRQFAKHNTERIGSDYSSINDKLHVMVEPVHADTYSIKAGEGEAQLRQENSTNGGSTNNSVCLSIPKSLVENALLNKSRSCLLQRTGQYLNIHPVINTKSQVVQLKTIIRL